jgi:putative membrane protein
MYFMPEWLPLFNTALIVVSGSFLGTGYFLIRKGHRVAHHRSMITASVFAALFLLVYVIRWVGFGTKPFEGPAGAHALYLTILVPHVIAAIVVGPLAIVTLRRAFRAEFTAHRRIALVTLPIWAFVAVSGWVIYAMLYLITWT